MGICLLFFGVPSYDVAQGYVLNWWIDLKNNSNRYNGYNGKGWGVGKVRDRKWDKAEEVLKWFLNPALIYSWLLQKHCSPPDNNSDWQSVHRKTIILGRSAYIYSNLLSPRRGRVGIIGCPWNNESWAHILSHICKKLHRMVFSSFASSNDCWKY